MGPSSCTPYWSSQWPSLGAPWHLPLASTDTQRELFWKELASQALRRANSYAAPCSRLPPLFSATLIMPPALRPYCASYELLWILNSCTESTGGTNPILLPPACALFGAPSSRNSFLRWLPLMLHSAIAPLSNGR